MLLQSSITRRLRKDAWRRCLPFGILLNASTAQAEPQHFRFDPVHTQITFFVSHLGFSRSSGRLHILEGEFLFDPDDWSASRVTVAIDINTLNLGDSGWEKKLKSDEFFNAKKFPAARFASESIEKLDDKRGLIHGALSLHGVTRKLDIPFSLNKIGVHVYTFKYTAGFSAALTLKRSDFGIRALLPGVGDEVEVRLEVEGQRTRDPMQTIAPSAQEPEDAVKK